MFRFLKDAASRTGANIQIQTNVTCWVRLRQSVVLSSIPPPTDEMRIERVTSENMRDAPDKWLYVRGASLYSKVACRDFVSLDASVTDAPPHVFLDEAGLAHELGAPPNPQEAQHYKDMPYLTYELYRVQFPAFGDVVTDCRRDALTEHSDLDVGTVLTSGRNVWCFQGKTAGHPGWADVALLYPQDGTWSNKLMLPLTSGLFEVRAET